MQRLSTTALQRLAWCGVGFTLLMGAHSATAKVLWVDRHSKGGVCSDTRTRDQVRATTPWCTLGVAGARVQPGDVVYIRQGVYSEVQTCESCNDNAVLQVVRSGTRTAWIRFESMPGEQVRLTGADGAAHGVQIIKTYDGIEPRYIAIKGLQVSGFPGNCVAVKQTSSVKLANLDVSGCKNGAVELHGTARTTLESSRIHHNALSGWTSAVDLLECGGGNMVRGNSIWANSDVHPAGTEGHGIIMDHCLSGRTTIENNAIWNNEGWCIVAYHSDGSAIRHNTCWQNGRGRADETGEVSILGRNHRIFNNILVPGAKKLALHIRENADYTGHFETIQADANILWAATHTDVVAWSDLRGSVAEYRTQNPAGWGKTDRQQNPLLMNPAAGDFRVRAGSPAIDSGDQNNAAASDIVGQTRPYDGNDDGSARVDRGAYEMR